MPRDPRMLLADVLDAAGSIVRFREGVDLSGYRADELIRAGVERKLEVIGEALNRLGREDPELVAQIPDVGRIVGFRNILAHGYEVVDTRSSGLPSPSTCRNSSEPSRRSCRRSKPGPPIPHGTQAVGMATPDPCLSLVGARGVAPS